MTNALIEQGLRSLQFDISACSVIYSVYNTNLLSIMWADISRAFTPVDRASRWEHVHIHSDLILQHGQVAWVPEPVDWKLMSEVNVCNMAANSRQFMVHVDSIPGLYKFVFDHEHNGVEV